MAISACDVVETLNGLLAGAGYAFHDGDAGTGETATEESGPDCWFTWSAPGMSGCECGPTCSSPLEALDSTLHQWFASAAIPAVCF